MQGYQRREDQASATTPTQRRADVGTDAPLQLKATSESGTAGGDWSAMTVSDKLATIRSGVQAKLQLKDGGEQAKKPAGKPISCRPIGTEELSEETSDEPRLKVMFQPGAAGGVASGMRVEMGSFASGVDRAEKGFSTAVFAAHASDVADPLVYPDQQWSLAQELAKRAAGGGDEPHTDGYEVKHE